MQLEGENSKKGIILGFLCGTSLKFNPLFFGIQRNLGYNYESS